MSIRRNLVAYLALFVVLGGTLYAAFGAAAASAGGRAGRRSAPRSCYPKGSFTIAQDKVGRFYSSRRPHQHWYVCAFRQRTTRELPYMPVPDSAMPSDSGATVSGRYVAFFLVQPGPGGVAVFDMVTGHRTFSKRGGVGTEPGSLALVLKANGSVAWTAHARGPIGPPWEVRRHDSTGTATVDSGSAIDPHSLAAGGLWLYWTNAGSARSAPFH